MVFNDGIAPNTGGSTEDRGEETVLWDNMGLTGRVGERSPTGRFSDSFPSILRLAVVFRGVFSSSEFAAVATGVTSTPQVTPAMSFHVCEVI